MNVAAILSAKGNTVEVVGPETPVYGGRAPHVDARASARSSSSGPTTSCSASSASATSCGRWTTTGRASSTSTCARSLNSSVATCTVTDDLAEVMRRMTATRSRHMPVLEGNQVVGLVSIGDVVKHRLGELELETHVLRDVYLSRS